MFQNYKAIAPSVVLLFNRYEEKEILSMNAKLTNMWKDLPPSSRDNKNLLDVFNDFKEKTRNQNNIIIFNPLSSSLENTKRTLDIIRKH